MRKGRGRREGRRRRVEAKGERGKGRREKKREGSSRRGKEGGK